MNIIKNKLYTFEDKTSDEVLLINGFSHINQLIPYVNYLQSQLEQKEKILQEIKEYVENDDVFRLPDLYSQSIADEIQKDLSSIIERSNSNVDNN